MIKPLSINGAFQGRRFKTPAYKQYEKDVILLLPAVKIPEGQLRLTATVGFSSKASDIDNVLKPFIDILQKKYKFDDKNIYSITINKQIVKKGCEFIKWNIEKILQTEGEIMADFT